MRRSYLAIAAAGALVFTTVVDAGPRGGGGGGRGFGGGGGGGGGGGRGFGGGGGGRGFGGGGGGGGAIRIGGGGAAIGGARFPNGGGAVGGVRVGGGGFNNVSPYRYGNPYRGGGLNVWFSPANFGSIPYTGRGGLYAASNYSIPSYYGAPVDTAVPSQPASEEWGLQITELMEGPAKIADLRKGDIILGVGQVRTQTLGELQKILAETRGQAEIVFINGESKNVEKLPVTPKEGKIGIAVTPVDLP